MEPICVCFLSHLFLPLVFNKYKRGKIPLGFRCTMLMYTATEVKGHILKRLCHFIIRRNRVFFFSICI